MSKKYKTIFVSQNYIEHCLISVSTVTGCIFVSVFASLIGILIRITNSAIGLNICAITATIKKYKSILMKEKETWWNSIAKELKRTEVLFSKTLIDSNMSHDKFILINDVPKNMTIWKKN